MWNASRSLTVCISSITSNQSVDGSLSLPMPSTLYGALSPLIARAMVIGEDRSDRIAGDDLDVGILLLQEFARTADRAAGTGGSDQVRDAPFGLLPDSGPVVR